MLARVGVTLGGQRFEAQLPVPDGPARPRDLLPAARQLTEAIVGRAVEQGGAAISCRKGCGACCRQVVPVSQPEARALSDVVERLPAPRRAVVQARFSAARERLESSGLMSRLQWPGEMTDAERQALAVDYFRLGIACPFLEDEACSIYADRPLVCREYLVTTPAENCAVPTQAPVTRVPLPGRMSLALGQLEPTTRERGAWWMPLINAPFWTAAHPDEPARQQPLDPLRKLLNWLAETSVIGQPRPVASGPGGMEPH